MRSLMLLLALVCSSVRADDWSPPQDADPQVILQEARKDTRAKRYETALAKHVWFHENALSIEPALYGVRLSFALSYWVELSEVYPPAREKLVLVRDQAQKRVIAGTTLRNSFHDMEAINDHLEDQSMTTTVFEMLDEKDPMIAKQVFDLAQPSLVASKAYALVGKYISPKIDFANFLAQYKRGKELSEDNRFGERHLDFANKNFSNSVSTLVAILVLNDRKAEAQEIAQSARPEWDDRSFQAALDKALDGVVPDPWP